MSARIDPRFRQVGETILILVVALVASVLLFGMFVSFVDVRPLDVYAVIYQGSVGSWFSWQNTLQRAAPLLLTALCTVIPARVGLIVVGNEGALVLGGLAAAAVGLATAHWPPPVVQLCMVVSGLFIGGLWIGAVGVLRYYRGVNEVISSLMLVYIAIAIFNHIIEGPLRGPSPQRPSTPPILDQDMIGNIPGLDVHWGLAYGVAYCVLSYFVLFHTTTGFSWRVIGGNVRAAEQSGISVGPLIVLACVLGGAAAGLAGALELAAVQGAATTSLISGYGFTGILVAFVARQNPIAVIPVALLFGGIKASGGLLQRHLGISDASVLVFQGVIFICVLASEALRNYSWRLPSRSVSQILLRRGK